ncbi:hypothetical protein SLEP1_g19382 [Rubroshorea leprosula]|nr:hypothetical protein SLEP1_g19382 [Rubroshorea leprosula]
MCKPLKNLSLTSYHLLLTSILDRKGILGEIPEARIHRVIQEANQCPNCLADMGRDLPAPLGYFDVCPPGYLMYSNADLNGN